MSLEPPFLELPESRREDYSSPWGPVIAGGLRDHVRGLKGLVCVGDIVSRYCLELVDILGNLILAYDMKTRRSEIVDSLKAPGFNIISVLNKRGTVSLEAYRILCDLIELNNVRAALEVIGEEDMLALPAISCLKRGWAVVYGVPGRGACIVHYSMLATRIAQTRLLQLSPPRGQVKR